MHIIGVLDAPSGPLSFVVVLTRPLTTPFALGADGVLLAGVAAYLLGILRSRGRSSREGGDATVGAPPWSTAAFLGGVLLLFAAVGSGLAHYQDRPSVLVVQHVFLMMSAPPLLVAGRPLRAWLAASRGPSGAPGPSGTSTSRADGHGAAGVLHAAQGVISWPLYYGSMAAFFLTPLLGASVRDPVLLDLVECWFVVVGLVFFSSFTVQAGGRGSRSYGFRIAALLAGAPLETAVGIAMILWPRPMIAGTALGATHAAGLVLWIASMVAGGAVLGAVLVQWVLDDARRGAEIDLLLDAGVTRVARTGVAVRPSGSGSGGGPSRP